MGTTSRSHGGHGFGLLPDPNGSSQENQLVALELMDRKLKEKGLPGQGIVVQEDMDVKVHLAEDKV